jgi:predicted phage terminase large subunit-like protein
MTKQEAAQELLIRRRARRSILDYANAIDIPGKPSTDDPDTEFFQPIETTIAQHHQLILTKLDQTANTRHGRLMIFCPPGSAKSTFASVVFPSRYLAQQKDRKIILTSYGDDLARKMGRRTRAILRQPRYKMIYGTELMPDSQGAQEFTLTNGSEYMACGILSGVTGNRANGLLIDDPIKGREQAESDTIRNKSWEAYQDDLLTRLVPGGWVCLITTRWHQDDIAGRILPVEWKGESGPIMCRDGNVWEVICLQARCEVPNDPLGRRRGEYLWPEWFDLKHWAQFEHNARTWSSLYQQLPVPSSGDLFEPDQIRIIPVAPEGDKITVRGWDLASVRDGGDHTAGVKFSRLNSGRYVIEDMQYFQRGPDERDAAILQTAELDGKKVGIDLPQDPGQAGKTQVLYLTRQLAGFKVYSSPESGDKVVRAEPVAAQVNVGNVDMVRGNWNYAMLQAMRGFPGSGTPDDPIDALSRAFARVMLKIPMVVSKTALHQMAHQPTKGH